MYAPNMKIPKYIKQKLREIKGEIDKSISIAGNFKKPLSVMHRQTNQQRYNRIELQH